MRESFEYEGTATGEYKNGLYVTYCGREYEAVYLGLGRFILYSDVADENFTFPTQDGRYLLQTDLRDSDLTRASEIRMIGMYEERDYLWNPSLGIYATFCQALNTNCETTWFAEKDRMTQVYVVENPKKEIE